MRNSDLGRLIGYLGFIGLFLTELAIASQHWASLEQLQAWHIGLLACAAFRGGMAIAEDEVFSWLRAPFTLTAKDATGAGDSVSPRYPGGLFGAIGGCLACPICTGTHVASALLTIYALQPNFGLLLIYALAAAGLAELLHASREYLFWHGRHAREQCQ